MTTAQISRITPPPSVEAVLGALTDETRIGQVDFSSRLTDPEVDEAAEVDPVDQVDQVNQAAEVEDESLDPELLHDAGDEDDESDEGHTAEIHTLVVARPAPDTEDEAVTGTETAEVPTAGRTSRRRTATRATVAPVAPVADLPATDDTDDTDGTDDTELTQASEGLEAGPADRETRRPILPEPLDLAALLDASQGVDERPPSIDEIACLVVERMHDAELAMMCHLEALENETVRRAELATAQAELDAELIRLNARREAHAIVTAARRRAGQDVEADPAQAELEEITETLTRFADVMDELRPSPRPGRRT